MSALPRGLENEMVMLIQIEQECAGFNLKPIATERPDPRISTDFR
jgi:hypothetical protein